MVCVNQSLRQKSVLPDMDNDMSRKTKQEALGKLRRQSARAGLPYQRQLLEPDMALFGYHRKVAIRALHAQPPPPSTDAANVRCRARSSCRFNGPRR